MPKNGRSIKLGPMETLLDLKDTLRILAKALAQLGDYTGASRNAATLASIELRTKELELKGLNMDGSAPVVRVELNDYAAQHDALLEENAALKAQVDMLMQGRERPRPPRPQMN